MKKIVSRFWLGLFGAAVIVFSADVAVADDEDRFDPLGLISIGL
ncbi:MAG: hypothetical protein OXI06_04160 [bacterium]|nr:hypothetical protein [bacterium]